MGLCLIMYVYVFLVRWLRIAHAMACAFLKPMGICLNMCMQMFLRSADGLHVFCSLLKVLKCESNVLQLLLTMAFAESSAVFASRAKEIGLAEDMVKTLAEAGIDSMATYAFACAFVPGNVDEKPFMEMLKKALKREPNLAETSRLRRLLHESYAVVAADLKAQVEQADDAGARKLAAPERAQRLKVQQARLQGLAICGASEPGDSLVDKAVAMYDSDRLTFLEWAKCISREHEIQTGSKRDPTLTMDSSGVSQVGEERQCGNDALY